MINDIEVKQIDDSKVQTRLLLNALIAQINNYRGGARKFSNYSISTKQHNFALNSIRMRSKTVQLP